MHSPNTATRSFLAFLLNIYVVAPLNAAPSAEDLNAAWEAARARIKTAQIETLQLMLHSNQKKLSAEQVRAFLRELAIVWDQTHQPAEVQKRTAVFFDDGRDASKGWSRIRITSRADELRNRTWSDRDQDPESPWSDHCFSQQTEVHYLAFARQASLCQNKSGIMLYGLQNIAYQTPIIKFANVVLQKEEASRLCWNLLKDNRRIRELETRPKSFEVIAERAFDKDNRCIWEVFQHGFTDYVGDDGAKITLPAISAEVRYDTDDENELVRHMMLFVTTSATFNVPLPEDAFFVSVPLGTRVVLHRGQTFATEEIAEMTSRGEMNVATLMPELQRRAIPEFPEFNWRSLVTVTAPSLVALLVGLWWYRRCTIKSVRQ